MGYFQVAGVKLVTTNDREKLLILKMGAGIFANKSLIPHGITIEGN